ncbi:hypothetical protein GGE12_000511 [Rhizobium mongolense]|uniref:Uncharacterized protein n=1 Tax=Rhizobium mongolense TaxID=57676 RepID=A0A7W6RI19_9HYPH|nr:hypothetical protein [Rhizobium mongolense]
MSRIIFLSCCQVTLTNLSVYSITSSCLRFPNIPKRVEGKAAQPVTLALKVNHMNIAFHSGFSRS